MGIRWILNLNCAYCGQTNKDVYYAPIGGFYSFHCKHCSKENWIQESFQTVKEETLEAIENRLGLGE